MTNIKWDLLWESVKLPLRMLVLAILPFAISYLTELGNGWATSVTSILVIIDRYLHLIWKEEEEKGLKRENPKPIGIVPF